MKLVVFGHGRLDISAMSGPSMLEIWAISGLPRPDITDFNFLFFYFLFIFFFFCAEGCFESSTRDNCVLQNSLKGGCKESFGGYIYNFSFSKYMLVFWQLWERDGIRGWRWCFSRPWKRCWGWCNNELGKG